MMVFSDAFLVIFVITSLLIPVFIFALLSHLIRSLVGSIGKKTLNTRNGYDAEYLKAKTQKEPEPVRYCDYCGGQIENGVTQCKYCGASIKQGVK